MKTITPTEWARLAAYIVAILLGAFMTVWGVMNSDAALVTAGIGLVGTGGLASANVRASGGKYAAD